MSLDFIIKLDIIHKNEKNSAIGIASMLANVGIDLVSKFIDTSRDKVFVNGYVTTTLSFYFSFSKTEADKYKRGYKL